MNPVYINAIAITGPGLPDWTASVPVLKGDAHYSYAEPEKFTAAILSANERRRTTPLIRLALQTAEQAMNMATTNAVLGESGASQVACVFASSDGDAEIIDKICSALTLPDRPVSPTQFHNSVHNAPAGYWAIATQSRQPSSSISAGHYSFAVGLTEAATFAWITEIPILLVVYDLPAPFPLTELTGVTQAFACALLVSPQQVANSLCRCRLSLVDAPADNCGNDALEFLRLSNPAARSLPLLEMIAAGQTGNVHLPYNEHNRLRAEISPC